MCHTSSRFMTKRESFVIPGSRREFSRKLIFFTVTGSMPLGYLIVPGVTGNTPVAGDTVPCPCSRSTCGGSPHLSFIRRSAHRSDDTKDACGNEIPCLTQIPREGSAGETVKRHFLYILFLRLRTICTAPIQNRKRTAVGSLRHLRHC